MAKVITIDPGKNKCGLVLAELREKKIYNAIIIKSELLEDYVRNLNNVEDISKIILDFTFIKPLNAKSQKLLERAAKHCPVSKSLDPNLEEIISFSYCD